MTSLHAGDLVIAIPINDCSIGHPDWHRDFANPEMNQKSYMVTWSGFSAYWKRPIIGIAGRAGHFCAGCFVKQKPARPVAEERVMRVPEPVS